MLMKKKLELAIQLSKSGDKEQARKILRELLDESPDIVNAWFWLVDAMPTDEERISVLEEAVFHHPADKRLTSALAKLVAEQEKVEIKPVSAPTVKPIITNPVEVLQDSVEELEAPENEGSAGLEPLDEELQSEFQDEDQDEVPSKAPKSAKKGSTNSRYLFIVFVLLIAALAVAYLFRDSLIELWAVETPISAEAPTATASEIPLVETDEAPAVSPTETMTPTSTEVPPTSTFTPSVGEGTSTAVVITTPTNTAVVEEGIFIAVPGSKVNDMAWSRDGDLFAIAGDGGIVIYDGENFSEKVHITLDPAIPLLTVTFSPDNEFIAAGFDQGKSGEELITRAKMWKVNDGAEVMSFDYNAPRGDIVELAFSNDGSTLLMDAKLDAILKWRVSDGVLLDVIRLSESSVDYYGVVFSTDRLSYATYSKFDRVRIYDTLFSEQAAVLGDEKAVTNAVFSANSQYLAVMFEENQDVFLWDLPSKEKIQSWNTFGGNVTCLAFDADNQTLAVGTDEDLIKFYQIRTGEEQRIISRQIPGVVEMEFAPDDILFAVRNEREIQVWHLLTDTLVATFRVVD